MCDFSITILTPTYNRAALLKRLYNSLINQTILNFEWLIVDDGSTDSTYELVNNFILENKIKIIYMKKENGGKHTALNYAIKKIFTKYTFIVDSDDYLKENAIEVIYNFDKKFFNNNNNYNNICGFSFLRQYSNGNVNVTLDANKECIGSYNKIRVYDRKIGDMAEVYLTSILKEYPFPVFEKEKFLGEDIVWIEIGKKYNLVFSNIVIYVSDYLDDGLTKNRRKNNIVSCEGSYARALQFLSIKLHFRDKVKTILQLIIYGRFCNKKFSNILKDSKTILTALLYFPGIIIYFNWKKYLNIKN